jgi:tetratricopeptide (TPR) repeat protein
MPFVRKTDSQGSQPPTDTRKLFIGRTGELLFFVQNILKPEEPTHNIISIWGQGGVGKSTLLARFIDEALTTDFKDYCLTAIVDELQTTPASIMEKFATQLHIQGAFEKALIHYKKALRTPQTEREMLQDTLLQRTPTFAGAAVEGLPFVGPLLGEGVKATAEHLLERRYNLQRHKDVELLEDPVNALTRAFVDELNQLAETQVLLGSRRFKKRRVLLFFDTFEQLAAEAAPWLLNYFLPADINGNIVLVIAGRDPIERSIPDDTKRWLPYCDDETIYWLPLNSFTEDETRAYLIKRNITDSERITTILQLSQGLPLYLSLLTSNPRGKVDPAADVVANFLRWIPEKERAKRQLALDAALFFGPFNQDDLTTFIYLPEDDQPSLYHWLVSQPFVRTQNGGYSYHNLARELFSRHLYQRSRKGYYTTRRALVQHYQQLIEEIQLDEGREVYTSTEWLELKLALACQLLLLPDEGSHIKAIEQVLSAYNLIKTEQRGEIARVLRELSQEHINIMVSSNSRQIARQLLHFIEADPRSKERVVAVSNLLEKVSNIPAFPQELLARLHIRRGIAFSYLNEYQRAIEDCNSAIQLNPEYAGAYVNRGYVFRRLREYELAIEDFNRALQLYPEDIWAYASRSLAYSELHEYQRAIEDCNSAIQLNPKYIWAYVCRSIAYRGLNKYPEAIEDCNRALELDSNYARAYFHRSIAYSRIKEYQLAIEDCNHAIKLDSKDSWAYIQRGLIYKQLEDYRQALENFELAIELDPNETWAYAQRGITFSVLKQYELALADFDRTIELNPQSSRTHGRRGFIYLVLKDITQAKSNYARSWEQDATLIHFGWMAEWTGMCQDNPDPGMAERLEMIAATDPEAYAAFVCRSVAMWLRKYYKEALIELEQAIQVGPEEWKWDSYFWKGMTYASLGLEEEARISIEKALELELPPILLTPLRWFQQDRPDFYQQYVVPLMARYDLG